MLEVTLDVLGWIGTGLIVGAYALISANRLHGSSLVYQGMNVVGSIFVGANALYYGAYPSVGINVLWILIGAIALQRIFMRRDVTSSDG
jgi:hypothetical protein